MVQVGGIATGLDVNGLVTQLVAAEISPAEFRIDRQEADYQADISSLGTLKAALNEFKTAVEDLDSVSDLRPRSVTNSNEDIVSLTADDTAVQGTYDIEVVRLAQEQRLMSGVFASMAASVGSGILTFTRGTDTFIVTVGAAAQTLEDVRDAINGAPDNPGVRAAIINVDDGSGGTDSRLVISSGETGVDNSLTITATDDDGNDADATGLSSLIYPAGGPGATMTEQQAAQDALIRVFGQDVTSASNTVSGAIDGVTLDLLADTSSSGNTASVTIGLDKGAVNTKINSFVTAYNSLVENLDTLGEYDATTETAGTLLGDPTLRTVSNNIRRELSTQVTGISGAFTSLAEIGITTQRDGRLALDSTALDEGLERDFDGVADLFASNAGYASRLSALIDGFVATDGPIESRIEGLNDQLRRLDGDRADLDLRAQRLEDRFRNQFAALDQLVAQLNTVGDFLAQNLASLPGTSIRSNR